MGKGREKTTFSGIEATCGGARGSVCPKKFGSCNFFLCVGDSCAHTFYFDFVFFFLYSYKYSDKENLGSIPQMSPTLFLRTGLSLARSLPSRLG